jgi:hypothetical protein
MIKQFAANGINFAFHSHHLGTADVAAAAAARQAFDLGKTSV